MDIPYGFCKCGCGEKTKIARQTRTKLNWIKGEPVNFINGHNAFHKKGFRCTSWTGGKHISNGYVRIYKPTHPKTNGNYMLEHILIAEMILGKPLPDGAVVHHINGKRGDNRPENLVICQNNAYHLFLHQRTRAYKACGHTDWRKCLHCKQYDSPENLTLLKTTAYHKKCRNQHDRDRRALRNSLSLQHTLI